MKSVYAACIAGLILMGCFKVTTSSQNRFTEPLRSQMMMQTLMSGVPITVSLCWEEELVKQGIKHPSQISREAFAKAQKQCEKTVVPAIKEEINKAMAEEEASKSI